VLDVLCGGERKGLCYKPAVLENVPNDAIKAERRPLGPVSIICFFFVNFDVRLLKEVNNRSVWFTSRYLYSRYLLSPQPWDGTGNGSGVVIGDVA